MTKNICGVQRAAEKNRACSPFPAGYPLLSAMSLPPAYQDYTRRVFQLFDCKGVIRIDYIIDKKDSSLYINEINTIPGSFAFYLWECSGLSYKELLDELIRYAVKAYEDSASSEYAYKSDILLNYSKGAESGSKGAKYSGKG